MLSADELALMEAIRASGSLSTLRFRRSRQAFDRTNAGVRALLVILDAGRAGFITEAGRQNMPLAGTMAMTGHRSVATVVGYFRAESALGSKVSRMLDES